jgi:probable HAF family extracellular repeat protein
MDPLPNPGMLFVTGINDASEVIGSYAGAGAPFVWSTRSGYQFLTLTAGDSGANAFAISNSGYIAGNGYNPTFGPHACMWTTSGVLLDIGYMLGRSGAAFGVNDSGLVAGWIATPLGEEAFLWSQNAGVTYLPGPLRSFAYVVNNLGHSAGTVNIGGKDEVVLWPNSSNFIDTGINGAQMEESTQVTGLNDSDEMIGIYEPPSGLSGFIWSPVTRTTTLPGLPMQDWPSSLPLGINKSGQIVGYTTKAGVPVAIVYQNGTVSNLNDLIPLNSGWYLEEAWGINNIGQIVGYGTLNGVTRGFVLTPNQ